MLPKCILRLFMVRKSKPKPTEPFRCHICEVEEEISWRLYPNGCPRSALCQFKREGEDESFTGYARDFAPEFNVANLLWRPTAIGRMELERMPEQMREMDYVSKFDGLVGQMGALGAGGGKFDSLFLSR